MTDIDTSTFVTTGGITVLPLETPTLGDRSYLVHDGEVAFVVDPQRDIDRVLDLAAEQRVRITHVLETHVQLRTARLEHGRPADSRHVGESQPDGFCRIVR